MNVDTPYEAVKYINGNVTDEFDRVYISDTFARPHVYPGKYLLVNNGWLIFSPERARQWLDEAFAEQRHLHILTQETGFIHDKQVAIFGLTYVLRLWELNSVNIRTIGYMNGFFWGSKRRWNDFAAIMSDIAHLPSNPLYRAQHIPPVLLHELFNLHPDLPNFMPGEWRELP